MDFISKRGFSPGFRQKMDINHEQFVTILRRALHHLYDPDHLRRSRLTGLFNLTDRVDASFTLQKILIDAIEAIQPEENDPVPGRGWLLHDVLFFRYVRGYERQAVADQLGISERQLSRDQRSALEALAQYLWTNYRLEARRENTPLASPGAEGAPGEAVAPLQPPGAPQDEDTWLDDLPLDIPSAWQPVLNSILELLQPLVHQHAVTLAYEPDEDLPDLLPPQTALRHALLNILGVIIPLARQGRLSLAPSVSAQTLTVTSTLNLPADRVPPAVASLLEHPSMAIARQLAVRAGGSLTLVELPGRLEIALTLPALAQVPVLVIDDNPDTIQLFQRYAQGTRYSVVGAVEADEFFQLLTKILPRIIVIDVMMPELDGWELLSRLRQEFEIQNTAIIVCSILPQESLARSLGADGFLQKPVLPQDFVQALDEQANSLARQP